MAKTRKPCPACHTAGLTLRDVDSICRSCELLMEDGRRFRRQSQRKSGQAILIPAEAAQYPYLSHVSRELARQLREAFHEVVIACSCESASDARRQQAPRLLPRDRDGLNCYTAHVFLEPATRDALRSLYQAIKDGFVQAFREGQRDGTRPLGDRHDPGYP